MQRVRIGLTGLAFVFLAVLLAAIFTNQSRDELPITPDLIEQQQHGGAPTPPAAAQPEPQGTEPLAEMGVAPGSDTNQADPPAAAPPPAPRPAGQ